MSTEAASKTLPESDISSALSGLPLWKREGKELVRFQAFPSYRDALEFVYRVGLEAEEADHHPDISMNFKRVTVRFTTHSAGGITPLDIKMASVVERWVWRYAGEGRAMA